MTSPDDARQASRPPDHRRNLGFSTANLSGDIAGGVTASVLALPAVALTDLRCLSLTVDALARINAEEPLLGLELLRCLARGLTRRIVIADRIATKLKA